MNIIVPISFIDMVHVYTCIYMYTYDCLYSLPVDSETSRDSGRPSKNTMLTFKQFLTQQDDDIEESDAITSYNSYKKEFRKKMMEEFFEQHKEEDW